ncbi:MAG: RsmB/NOP family class I SAM-dependent RNA methyltransferase [Caulobacterales bacterium]
MRFAGRIAAAIEVLTDVEAKKRPVTDALKDWGASHRFAGSKDRAAIGDFVFDALRTRASSAWSFGEDSARAAVLATALPDAAVMDDARSQFAESDHAPEMSEADWAALDPDARANRLKDAPPHVLGDYPEWLDAKLARAYGDARAEEGAAMRQRPPLDLRANTIFCSRRELAGKLKENPAIDAAGEGALRPTPFAPNGARLAPALAQGRFAPTATAEFLKGWFEVQDEGSQLSVALSGAREGMQVIDLCAGGGGKTLALAAQMENKGQIYAFDSDAKRLAKAFDRIERANARNVQIRFPKAGGVELDDLHERADVVFVDAPCTGSGVWRRNPDAKWRVRPGALEQRQKEQAEVLKRAAGLVKPGGRIVYVTCSLLMEENEDQIADFLAAHPDFAPIDPQGLVLEELGEDKGGKLLAAAKLAPGATAVRLSPLRTQTDGFFIAALERQ